MCAFRDALLLRNNYWFAGLTLRGGGVSLEATAECTSHEYPHWSQQTRAKNKEQDIMLISKFDKLFSILTKEYDLMKLFSVFS